MMFNFSLKANCYVHYANSWRTGIQYAWKNADNSILGILKAHHLHHKLFNKMFVLDTSHQRLYGVFDGLNTQLNGKLGHSICIQNCTQLHLFLIWSYNYNIYIDNIYICLNHTLSALFVYIFVVIILPNYIHQFLIYKKLKGFYVIIAVFLSFYVINASINSVFDTCNGILLVEVYEENSRKICQYQ